MVRDRTVDLSIEGTPDPVAADLFVVDERGLTLLGGWSPTSGFHHFPRRARCPMTGAADVETVELPREGRLLWWTSVLAAPPGYTGAVPYGLGVVELPLQPVLRVVGRLTVHDVDALREHQPMTVVADLVVDQEGNTRTTWAFAPEAAT